MQYWRNERKGPYLYVQDCRGEEWQGLLSAGPSPAVALQPPGSGRLTKGSQTPGPRPDHCSAGAGKGRRGLLPGQANGKQPLSREVLLTITFPLQGCPVLPQTPGSSVACSTSWAVPRLHLPLARRMRCGFCWCRDVWGGCQQFYLHISSASQRASPCFCLLKPKARNVDLESRCCLLCYSGSPVLVHIQASCSPIFSLFLP